MRWYDGSIAEAVTASKKKGAVFVVFVEGSDHKSKQLSSLVDSKHISEQLESEYFVAIKVEENTVSYQQFSQIYKQATVPSLFFIGKTGIPLEIITEPQSEGELSSKIGTILEKNGVNVSHESVTPTNQFVGTSAAVSSIATQEEHFLQTERSQQNLVDCQDGVCSIKPKDAPCTSKEKDGDIPTDDQKDVSPEDKVERAKEILVQKREAKQKEEEENARLKELERRKVGQDVQKLKRWQQEQELKEMMDERNKEKKEQQEARQRVLAQIAQDKAERAAKFSAQKPQPQPTSAQPTHRAPANNSIARLQFKLPDGSSYTHEFPSSSSLQDIRSYIITNLDLPFANFTLSTTFPRREFTSDNSSDTLLELELVPNAVILVLPIHHGAVATNSDSWLITVFWSIIGPFLNALSYLKQKLFGRNRPNPPPQPSPQPDRKRPNENAGQPSNVSKRRLGDSTVVRRQGNVHRLTDKADSDDDNNTWNGNSTQQM